MKSLYTEHEIKNRSQIQRYDLDAIDVYHEDLNGDYFDVTGIDAILPYGKTYFIVNIKDTTASLQDGSNIIFEFKDSDNNVIRSGVTPLSIDEDGVCYVYLESQDNYSFKEIKDGIGTLTIVGELSNVPPRYKGVYNIRYTKEFQIRKNYPNNSDILFKQKPKLEVVETVENDNVPLPSVTKACPFDPSDVGYVNPATSSPVLFNSCNLSDLSLAVITFEPSFLFANSIKPSSVPSLASSILPVIFA